MVHDGTWKFLHDNAPIHCGYRVKQFLEEKLIETMDFPSYSPDLNPIEDPWSYIVRLIHDGGTQFHSINILKQAILVA